MFSCEQIHTTQWLSVKATRKFRHMGRNLEKRKNMASYQNISAIELSFLNLLIRLMLRIFCIVKSIHSNDTLWKFLILTTKLLMSTNRKNISDYNCNQGSLSRELALHPEMKLWGMPLRNCVWSMCATTLILTGSASSCEIWRHTTEAIKVTRNKVVSASDWLKHASHRRAGSMATTPYKMPTAPYWLHWCETVLAQAQDKSTWEPVEEGRSRL